MQWWDNALMPSKYFLSLFQFSLKRNLSLSLPFSRLLGHPKRHNYVTYHFSPSMHWLDNALIKSVDRQTYIQTAWHRRWWSQYPTGPKGWRVKMHKKFQTVGQMRDDEVDISSEPCYILVPHFLGYLVAVRQHVSWECCHKYNNNCS